MITNLDTALRVLGGEFPAATLEARAESAATIINAQALGICPELTFQQAEGVREARDLDLLELDPSGDGTWTVREDAFDDDDDDPDSLESEMDAPEITLDSVVMGSHDGAASLDISHFSVYGRPAFSVDWRPLDHGAQPDVLVHPAKRATPGAYRAARDLVDALGGIDALTVGLMMLDKGGTYTPA